MTNFIDASDCVCVYLCGTVVVLPLAGYRCVFFLRQFQNCVCVVYGTIFYYGMVAQVVKKFESLKVKAMKFESMTQYRSLRSKLFIDRSIIKTFYFDGDCAFLSPRRRSNVWPSMMKSEVILKKIHAWYAIIKIHYLATP